MRFRLSGEASGMRGYHGIACSGRSNHSLALPAVGARRLAEATHEAVGEMALVVEADPGGDLAHRQVGGAQQARDILRKTGGIVDDADFREFPPAGDDFYYPGKAKKPAAVG